MISVLASVLSGLLAVVSFPVILGLVEFPRMGWIAWFALVPLYAVLRHAAPRDAARIGLIFGTVFYLGTLYWIFIAMHVYGEVPVWGSLIALILLVVILSLYFSAAFAAAAALRGRVPFWVLLPAAWVAQDFCRNFFPFGGFSWSSLGYTQAAWTRLIQVADLTGVWGVTFLVVLVNAVLGETIACRRKKRFPRTAAAVTAAAVAASLLYGGVRLRQIDRLIPALPTKKIGVVQANIPQEEKWLLDHSDEIIARHLVMSREPAAAGADLIIWPEAAFPLVIAPGVQEVELLDELTRPLLMGVVTYEGILPNEWPPAPDDSSFRLHNSAAVVLPGGILDGMIHKTHLVPMGEYVPLARIFYFLQQVVPAVSSFSPGQTLELLEADGVEAGVTICYEDLFPEINRTYTRRGAELLINLTNDAWYGRSSAVPQHFDFSLFRAVESRRFLVRATNNGVTGVVDPAGRLAERLPTDREAVLTAEVGLGGPASLYTRAGDWFGWCCLGFLVLLGVVQRSPRARA